MAILVAIATLLLCVPNPRPNPLAVAEFSSQDINAQPETTASENAKEESPARASSIIGKKDAPATEKCHTDSHYISTDSLYRGYLWANIIGVGVALAGLGAIFKQSIAATNAANAAKKSTDTLIASERAWVMVDIEWQLGPHVFDDDLRNGGKSLSIYVNFICRNVGKSFAQITGKGYVFKIFNDHPPSKPDFSEIEWIYLVNKYLKPSQEDDAYELSGIFANGSYTSQPHSLIFFYGKVEYRDVYGPHETIFGYLITPEGDLVRLPFDMWPEYNKHT